MKVPTNCIGPCFIYRMHIGAEVAIISGFEVMALLFPLRIHPLKIPTEISLVVFFWPSMKEGRHLKKRHKFVIVQQAFII